MRIGEKGLGPDHPFVAEVLTNLAELHRTQGEFLQAEPLYKRALGIREKDLEPDHPDTAILIQNYAGVLREIGRSAEADSLLNRLPSVEGVLYQTVS